MIESLYAGWEKIRLRQVAEKVTVGHVGPMKDEYVSDGIPFLRSQDVEPFRLNMDSVKFISEVFHKKLNKSSLHPGDVVVVRTGYPGTACVIPTSLPVANCADLVIVKPSDRLNSFFLACLFNSTWGRKSVSGSLVGVAQQHFNVTVAKEMIIPFPPRKVQDKIATIHSAYDDLIENNLRRIKILEEMAQTLYRELFVKLRFPGHQKVKMVNSPLGKIPEGWEVRQIGEVIGTLGGGTPSTKEPSYWEGGNIDWYSPSDLTASGSMFINGSSKKINQLGLDKSSAKLFPAYSLMMTSRATIGVISINTEKACTNQGFITCIPNKRLSVFHLYFWIKESREKIISVASGATFKEISRGEFREFPIVVPPLPIENTFAETVEPMCRLIENLIKKNQNLVVTRDLLLPKLISGELDVSELDIAVPEEAEA
jgi:type I restriction enzyme S subunit